MINFARKLARSAPLHFFTCLFLICLLASATATAQEQLAANNKPAPRKSAPAASRATAPRRVVLRTAVVAGGSRVTITSDAPLDDYAAYRQGGRFYVRVPDATAATGASIADGAGFTDARVEQDGDELVVSFRLYPNAAARVTQKFNRLEVVFSAQQDQQSGSGNNAPKPADAKPTPAPSPAPTPTPAPSPTTNTTPPVSAPDGAPAETKAAGATEAVKGTAEPATTKAARYAALLTPEKKNPVKVSKFDKPPVIDGKLDDEVWKSAARFADFIQNRPGDLIAPSKQTEAYIGYDAKTLYIAFKAFDEPDKVRSTVAKRDAVFDDDWVGVWLDTFNDGRRAYELIFNPLGVQADAIFTEGVSEDFSVDIVHESKGALTTDGYVVEIAIPFKSLRYTAGKDRLWGLHLLRTIKRFNNEQSSWMPISRDNSSLLGQRGYITGLEGISAERTLEIIPSLTISETGRRVNSPVPGSPIPAGRTTAPPLDRLLNKPIEFDPGITTKFTVTPQVTLDFTYNPDFAQVEADATVVTANQRFPIFFEEKRPFFLEGKEIFETLISAVHTRAIVDPDYAVKLTGKQGRNTFGIMAASDNAPGNLDDDDRDFIRRTLNSTDPGEIAERDALAKLLDRNATIGVVRLKRDVGKENHVGLLATTYNFLDKYNHVIGGDARWRLNKTTTFTAQVMGSVSHQPFFYPEEAGRFDRKETGMVYGAYLNMNGRNWGYELGAVGRSKRFRADVGFNRRFDTNNPTLFVRYQSTDKPKQTLVAWRAYNFFGSNFDWKGRHQRYVNESQFQLRMQRQTFIGLGFEKGYERVFEDEFGGTRAAVSRLNREEFAPLVGEERLNALPGCDPTGGLDPIIPDDRSTPDIDESRRLAQCTFSGADTERSSDRTSVYWYVETRPSKKYSVFVFSSYNWGVLDFDFGSGSPNYPRVSPSALAFGQGAPLDPGAGNEFFLESTFNYQPTDALRMSLLYTKDRLRRHDTGRLAFDDNIFSLRGTYQFTRFWFARGRVDYTTLSSRMRMQYLLGWTPNPGTQFYVGYNDDLNRNGFNPFTGDPEPGFRRNGRTFFIKMSYLIRKSFGND